MKAEPLGWVGMPLSLASSSLFHRATHTHTHTHTPSQMRPTLSTPLTTRQAGQHRAVGLAVRASRREEVRKEETMDARFLSFRPPFPPHHPPSRRVMGRSRRPICDALPLIV